MKRPNVLWIVALFLGWAFDFLFWRHKPGIGFAVYVVLCLTGGFLALLWNGIKPSWKSLLLLIPILFFAAMTAVRREPMSVFLASIFPLMLLGVLAVTYLGGRWMQYSLSDYVANLFKLAGSMIARPILFLVEEKKKAGKGENAGQPGAGARSGWKRVGAVLRGALIALPIVAVFAALLSSADLVFAARLDDFIQLFRLERLPEYIFRGFYILVFAYALAGAILHAGQKSGDEKLIGVEKPLVPPFLGFTETAIVLGAVNLLFGAFVIIQFQYFFGGQTNIGVEGYTYAEYARRGFGELVAVAFFSLMLFLGLSAVARRENAAQRWTFSGLGVLLVTLVGMMLFSAFQRLMLYEAAYGFTRLRTYTHVFMIWLGALLAVVVLLEILRRERAFALAAVLASIGFAATLTLMNVDGFIVRHNVTRAVQGGDLDAAYLASLSTDSVPDLVTALQDESLPAGTRDAVGAALACRTVTIGRNEPDVNWRAFTFSALWANRALEQVQEILDNYTLHDDDWPPQVETPLGETYDCWTGWMD
jgi:hypothetical protein